MTAETQCPDCVAPLVRVPLIVRWRNVGTDQSWVCCLECRAQFLLHRTDGELSRIVGSAPLRTEPVRTKTWRDRPALF